MSVSNVDDTMPPIIGTAMRCMTSDPVPVLHMIGKQPGHDGDDGHHLGPHALDRADHDGLVQVRRVNGLRLRLRAVLCISSVAWSR